MFPLESIFPLLLVTIASVFFEPLFWVVVFLVALQYRRTSAVKENLFGLQMRHTWSDTLLATGYGVLGGIAGSVLIVFVGLTLSGSSMLYLWPVAILLMLINARFICFAYAAGVLAMANLILGFPPLPVVQILALVAILHMVESMLILVSGHLGAVPGYFKVRGEQVVGGFTLQRFWPIPIVVLMVGHALTPEGISMPDWWPLLKTTVTGHEENAVYNLVPVVAGLGYGDLAIERPPWQKSRLSALFLGIYSLILLLFTVFAQNIRAFAFAAAVFSPLGHELVIYMGKKLEFSGRPVYIPSLQGVRVLDTVVNTPAWKAGIRSGDIILSVHGRPVFNKRELIAFLDGVAGAVEVTFLHGRKLIYRRALVSVNAVNGARAFGILAVPEETEQVYMELNTTGPLGRRLRKFLAKFRM